MKITKKKFILKLSAVVFAVLVILFLWWNFGEDPTDYSIFHSIGQLVIKVLVLQVQI